MTDLKSIHALILEGFNKEGLTRGVTLYEENRSFYESASEYEVLPLWKELLDAAFIVGGFVEPISILQKDDPFLIRDLDLMTEEKMRSIRKYRQEFAIRADLVLYSLQTYKRSKDLVDRIGDISIPNYSQ